MAQDKRTCELCGMEIQGSPVVLQTKERRLEFCCEGCLGVYKLFNEVEDAADGKGERKPPPRGS